MKTRIILDIYCVRSLVFWYDIPSVIKIAIKKMRISK